jgi:murein L,D-transpeptidase YcbB/YkuD
MQALRAPAQRGRYHAGLSGASFQGAARIATFAALAFMLAHPSPTLAAQANWWEGITGYGTPDYTGRRGEEQEQQRAAHAQEPLDDLRPDPTPWRSDEMLASMQAAIDRYQDIVDRGGWPIVPPGRMMREGDEDDRVPILRKRLRISGDLVVHTSSYNSSYSYDSDLADAVARFQRRNGLRPTGRIERSTYPALNMTAEARLAQLRLNLGRIRDLMAAGRVEPRYILVNIPAFQLEAVENYEVQQRHRVIVGRTERQSPSVKATVRALNFFPYWRVPDSVAHLDLIPHLLKEPDYLQKEKIRVLNGAEGAEVDPVAVNWNSAAAAKLKFRQDPGPQNALGVVRIDMPNENNVYMHDTPMKPLFAQRARAFSAGCVRVEGVLDLVDWIARYEPGWEQPGRARSIVDGGRQADFNLSRPLPVYFVYITAWAERSGDLEFRPDIYGRDGAVDTVAEMDRDPAELPPQPTLAP